MPNNDKNEETPNPEDGKSQDHGNENQSKKPDQEPEVPPELRAFYDAAGVDPPEELDQSAPWLFYTRPLGEVCRTVADHLRGRNLLFRRGRELVTIDHEGIPELMTPNRFRSWLEVIGGLLPAAGSTKDGKVRQAQLPSDIAAVVIASDEVRVKMPELKKVNPVRLPIWNGNELELAPDGYHSPTKTFTIPGSLPYPEDTDPKAAVKRLRELLEFFPWGAGEPVAVQVAAMLTVYCRRLFSGNSPLFVWNSNVGGAGKSRLSDLVLCPIFGAPTSFGYDQWDQKELKSTLDAVAASGADYLRFDDFALPPGKQLKSNHLNRWMTADHWETRIFGSNTSTFKAELETTTVITGTKLDLEAQLRRRALFVDLFSTDQLAERKLPEEAVILTKKLVESEAFRAEILGILWSLVRSWSEAGRPRTKEKKLDSFEPWSELIPSIVEFHGFGNALAPFEAPDAGDTESGSFRRLVEALVRAHCIRPALKRVAVTGRDVIEAARSMGLFADVVGTVEEITAELESRRKWSLTDENGNQFEDVGGMSITDPDDLPAEVKRRQALRYIDQRIGSSWGKRWKAGAVDGQVFRVDGRRWQFGRRGKSSASTFEITELSEGEAADQTIDPVDYVPTPAAPVAEPVELTPEQAREARREKYNQTRDERDLIDPARPIESALEENLIERPNVCPDRLEELGLSADDARAAGLEVDEIEDPF